MSTHLFTVAAATDMETLHLGSGVVLTPGIPEGKPLVRVGSAIALRFPNSTSYRTTVASFPLICGPAIGVAAPIAVTGELHATQIPCGTEVWLLA